MVAVLKVARQEKRKRQAMKRELEELKGDFAKLKGMMRLVVASLNLQSNGFPTEDVQDVFNPQVTEGLSEEEEVPQENVVTIPVPGPSMEIPQTLQEIPPSPGLSLQAQPIVVASSIPPLGSSPQLLCLLVEDSTVGVGATVEEFEEAVEWEAEMDAMIETLVESEEEPLTNDPDAVGELLEAWDVVVDTLRVGTMVEGLYRHSSCLVVYSCLQWKLLSCCS